MVLRAGIIGGGWIARRHVPAIDAAEDLTLVAACDADLSRARAIAEPRQARAYEEWLQMLDREQLDALWVCTPPLFHRDPVVAALSRNISVYLEKPIARTRADAEAIVSAADASDAICMVGYQWHATELLDEVRGALADRPVGMLIGRNYGPVAARPWFVDRTQGGGQILERGSHHIDFQRAIAGEVVAVRAFGGSVELAQHDRGAAAIEDVVALDLRFENGALGTVNMAWTAAGQPELYSVDVLARDASIWLELGPEQFRARGRAADTSVDAVYGDPFDRSVARFLEVIRSGDKSRVFCAADDALRTLIVALACEQALAEGGTASVDARPL
jgi:myo-inositol 2-dehydrogenase / D-chiro-inositol 1-dehydrogenase